MNLKTTGLTLACAVGLGAALPALAQTPGPTDTGAMSNGSTSTTASGPHIYKINSQNGSTEAGTVTLGAQGADKTVVSVDIDGTTGIQPDHIHRGTCANLDPAPLFPLNNLIRGHSRTVVNTSLSSLIAGGYAVNVHESLNDLKDYVACGDLVPANATSTSAQPAPSATPKGGH